MSGFASNIILSGKVFAPPEIQPVEQEAAGKAGKILGAVAAIIVPFAAPAVWGAIAGSTAIGASIAGAATGVFGAALTNVLGSAVVGGLMNAGIAYASGARGGQVWQAFGSAALSSGTGALTRAATTAAGGLNAIGGQGPVVLAPTAGSTTNLAIGASSATGGFMETVRNTVGSAISNIDLNRLGAAVINAAVNGQSMGELDDAVAQARAELEILRQQDQAAYMQRISTAQQILADADRQDPSWLARVRMGDVAGVMNREHDQALRNIAVRQGGSLDSGQRKAYERSGRLDIGRAKALAWGQGWGEGVRNQAALRGQAAGLLTGPNAQLWEAGTRLSMDQVEQRNRLRASTAGGFASVFNGGNYAPSTSPETQQSNQNQNDEETDAFTAGLQWPRG